MLRSASSLSVRHHVTADGRNQCARQRRTVNRGLTLTLYAQYKHGVGVGTHQHILAHGERLSGYVQAMLRQRQNSIQIVRQQHPARFIHHRNWQ